MRSLRAQADGARPIILISTTEMDAGEIAHAVAAGIDDYLVEERTSRRTFFPPS